MDLDIYEHVGSAQDSDKKLMSDIDAFKYKIHENDKILFKKNPGVMKIKNENYPIDLKKLNSTTRYEKN